MYRKRHCFSEDFEAVARLFDFEDSGKGIVRARPCLTVRSQADVPLLDCLEASSAMSVLSMQDASSQSTAVSMHRPTVYRKWHCFSEDCEAVARPFDFEDSSNGIMRARPCLTVRSQADVPLLDCLEASSAMSVLSM